MNSQSTTDVRLTETPITGAEISQSLPGSRISRRRLALAFAVASLADGLSILLTWTPPVQWAADIVTAVVLFLALGWQWLLLPGLIMEAVPGLDVLPFWVLVVGAVAVWGTARPKMKTPLHEEH
jgi:hypothetical protein